MAHLPEPTSASDGYVAVGWEYNLGLAKWNERVMYWRVRLLQGALGSLTIGLDQLCIEFWNNLRTLIAFDWPKPIEVDVLAPNGNILALVSHENLGPCMHPHASTDYQLSTCVYIEGLSDGIWGERLGRTSFLLQTAGAFPLPASTQTFNSSDWPEIDAFCDYLDNSPWFWADKWGRKALCTRKIRIFSHAFIQSHYLIPTPQI